MICKFKKYSRLKKSGRLYDAPRSALSRRSSWCRACTSKHFSSKNETGFKLHK